MTLDKLGLGIESRWRLLGRRSGSCGNPLIHGAKVRSGRSCYGAYGTVKDPDLQGLVQIPAIG